MLQGIKTVFIVELLLRWRASHEWLYPLCFFGMILALFPFALNPDPLFLKYYAPNLIWFAAFIASILSMQHIFLSELEDAHLEQWFLSRHSRTLSLLAKLTAAWLVNQGPLIVLIPCLALIFNLSFSISLALLLSLILGTPLLLLLGSLSAALCFGLRQQGLILALLMLPLSLPILIIGIMIVQQAAAGIAYHALIFFLAGILLLGISFIPLAIIYTWRLSLSN